MNKELHEYRVKPARGYGTTRRVVLQAILSNAFNLTPLNYDHMRLNYDDKVVVCYNPQKLHFNPNTVASALQNIHGLCREIKIVIKENKK